MDKKDEEEPKLVGFVEDNIGPDNEIIPEKSSNGGCSAKKKYFFIFASIFLIILIIGVISVFLCIKPQSKVGQKSSSENETFAKAKKYFEEGSYTKSLDLGNQCISSSGSEIGCYFIVIESLLKLKNFDKIEELINTLDTQIKKQKINKEYSQKFISLKSKVTTEKSTLEKYMSLYPDTARFIPNFYQSFFEGGGKINDNEIYYNDFGLRGVVATEDIEKNSIITEIPLDMLIKESDIYEYMVDKLAKKENTTTKSIDIAFHRCAFGKQMALGLYLLENKDNRTEENYRLYDYIQMMLSSGYDEFPDNYNEKLDALINETTLFRLIETQRTRMNNCYHEFNTSFNNTFRSNEKLYTLQNLKNIHLAISSRIFGDMINNELEAALVPYLDMLNHNKTKNTDWHYDSERKSFVCRSNTKIKKGAEVTDTYGEFKSNSELLLYYGFTDADNTDQDEIYIMYNGFFKVRSYLRKLNETNKDNYNNTIIENELESLIEAVKDGAFRHGNTIKGGFNKKELEIETFDRLNGTLHIKEGIFRKTLEEDEETFRKSQDKMTFNEINIYRIRIGEKRVFKWLISFAIKLKNYFQDFPDDDKEFDERIVKDFSTINDTDIKSYLEVFFNATEIEEKKE